MRTIGIDKIMMQNEFEFPYMHKLDTNITYIINQNSFNK